MPIPKRITLVSASELKFTSVKLPETILVTPDMLEALKKMEDSIKSAGGTLKINSLYRSWAKQQSLVDLHNEDVELNKVDPNHKITHAYAALPGGSYHQAGRSVDISLSDLGFPDIPKEKWLEKLWSIYKPLGFTPIIKTPNMNESEAWHADYVGPWAAVKSKFGNPTAAKCAILDVGNWDPKARSTSVINMFIQAQLLRLGYDIGPVDGIIGMKTSRALKNLSLFKLPTDDIVAALCNK